MSDILEPLHSGDYFLHHEDSKAPPTVKRSFTKVILFSLVGVAMGAAAFEFVSRSAREDQVQLLGSTSIGPGLDNNITMYSESDFNGKVQPFDTENPFYKEYSTFCWAPQVLASSIKVGKNVRAQFFKTRDCSRGGVQDMFEIIGPYMDSSLDSCWNRSIWSIKYQPYDSKTDPRVFMTDGHDFGVSCAAGSYPVGTYNYDSLNKFWFYNDDFYDGVSTILVQPGLQVTVYDQNYQTGNQKTIVGPQTVYLKNWGDDKDKWDNAIQSFKVEIYGVGTLTLKGYWKRIFSQNGQLSIELSVGTTITNTNTKSQEIQNSLTASVSASFELDGLGSASASMSYSYTQTMSQELSHSLENSKTQTIQGLCEGKGSEVTVVLWQWQVEVVGSSGDSIAMQQASDQVCRYGVNANTLPACPPGYCADGQCTKCTNDDWKQQ